MTSQSDKHKTGIGSAIHCICDRLIDTAAHCVLDLKRASLCSRDAVAVQACIEGQTEWSC